MAIKEGPQAPLQPAPPEKRAREAQVRKQTFIRMVGSIGLATAAGLGLFAGYDALLAPKGQDQKPGQTTLVPTFGETPGDTPTITPESPAQLETSVQNFLNGQPPINDNNRFLDGHGKPLLCSTTDAVDGSEAQAFVIGFTQVPNANDPSKQQYIVELGFEDYQYNRLAVAFHTDNLSDITWFLIGKNSNHDAIKFNFDHNAGSGEQVGAEINADEGQTIIVNLILGSISHWPEYVQQDANQQTSTSQALSKYLTQLKTQSVNDVSIPDSLQPFISVGSKVVIPSSANQHGPLFLGLDKYVAPTANIDAPILPTITTAANINKAVEIPTASPQPLVYETTTGKNPSVIVGLKPEGNQKPKRPDGVSYADWVIARAAQAKQKELDMKNNPFQGNRRDKAA